LFGGKRKEERGKWKEESGKRKVERGRCMVESALNPLSPLQLERGRG